MLEDSPRTPVDIPGVLDLSLQRLTPIDPADSAFSGEIRYSAKHGAFRLDPVASSAEVGGENRPVALVVELDPEVPEVAKGRGLKALEKMISRWFPGTLDRSRVHGVLTDESGAPRVWAVPFLPAVLTKQIGALLEKDFAISSHSPRIADFLADRTNAGAVVDDLKGGDQTHLIGVAAQRETPGEADAMDFMNAGGAGTAKEISAFSAILSDGRYPGKALAEEFPGLAPIIPVMEEAEGRVSNWLSGRSFADVFLGRPPTPPSKRMPQTLVTGEKETLAVTPLPNLEIMNALHEAADARNQQYMEASKKLKKAGKGESPGFKRVTESPFLSAVTQPQNFTYRKDLPGRCLHHGAPSSSPAMLRLYQQIRDPSALAVNGLRRWLHKDPDRRKAVGRLGEKVIAESGQNSARKNQFFLMLMWPLRDIYKRFLEEVSSQEQEGLASSQDIAWTHYDLANAWVRACERELADEWGINEAEGILDQTLLTALDGTPHANRTNLRTQLRGSVMGGLRPVEEDLKQPVEQFPKEYPDSMVKADETQSLKEDA